MSFIISYSSPFISFHLVTTSVVCVIPGVLHLSRGSFDVTREFGCFLCLFFSGPWLVDGMHSEGDLS